MRRHRETAAPDRGGVTMTRDQVLDDIRNTMGGVPQYFNMLPDNILEHEWLAWKTIHIENTKIPGKYKSLIGLAVASGIQCPHAQYAHREFAKFQGASDEEITEALLVAKDAAGWSTFIAGAGIDLEQYEQSVRDQIQQLKQKKAA
jgi:AhpD family alkylhydroperoxidase